MYVGSIFNYLHNFKRSVKCATIKTKIVIENGRSLKLHQTRAFHQVRMPSASTPDQIATNE